MIAKSVVLDPSTCVFTASPKSRGRGVSMLDEIDQKFFKIAYEEAITGFDDGGCSIGGVLAMGADLIGI